MLKAAVERQLPVVAPPQMVSTAEPLRDKIVELAQKGVKARAIFDRLRLEDPTFSASYWAVRGVWRRWRKERGVRAEDVAIPVETGPGEVAQVDFGYVGKLRDAATGMLRKAWVFVMVARSFLVGPCRSRASLPLRPRPVALEREQQRSG